MELALLNYVGLTSIRLLSRTPFLLSVGNFSIKMSKGSLQIELLHVLSTGRSAKANYFLYRRSHLEKKFLDTGLRGYTAQ